MGWTPLSSGNVFLWRLESPTINTTDIPESLITISIDGLPGKMKIVNVYPQGSFGSDSNHSFNQAISVAPLPVQYYSEAFPTRQGYCVGVSRRSATGNCE